MAGLSAKVNRAVNPLRANEIDEDPHAAERQQIIDTVINKAKMLGLDPAEVTRAYESGDEAAISKIELAEQAHASQKAQGGPYQPAIPDSPAVATQAAITAVDPNQFLNDVKAEMKPTVNNSLTRAVESNVAETKVAAESGSSPVVNPFAIAGDMKNRVAGVETELDTQVNFARAYRDKVTQTNEKKSAFVKPIIAQQEALNNEQIADNNALGDRLKPFLSRKAKTDERINQLENGQGFLSQLLGSFDPNHNLDALREKSQTYLSEAQGIAQAYQVSSNQREQFLNLLERKGQLGTESDDLDLALLEQSQRANVMNLQVAEQKFQFLGQTLSANTQVVAAQIQKRDLFLSEQTPDKIAGLLGKAEANGGTVMVDGIPVSAGQLKEANMAWNQRLMAEESAQDSLAVGKLNRAAAYTSQSLRLSTVEQLSAIRASGYKLNGRAVPPNEVDALINQGIENRNITASQIAQQGTPGVLSNELRRFGGQFNQFNAKLRSTYGGRIPNAMAPFIAEVTAFADQANVQLQAAKKAGVLSQTSTLLLGQMAKMQERMDGVVKGVANQMADGDKVGAIFAERYLKGDQFSATDSFQFAKHFTENGGLPTQMRMNPGANSMMKAYRDADDAVTKEMTAKGMKVDKVTRARIVQREFTARASKLLGDQSFSDFQDSTPRVAATIGHPFAGVSRSDWAKAQGAGESAAYQAIADRTNLPVETARALWNGNYEGADVAQLKKLITSQVRQAANSASQVGLLNALDESPSAKTMKMRPSDAYVDLMQSPDFHQKAGEYDSFGQKYSMGGAVASGLSKGAINQNFSSYARNIAQIQQERTAALTAGTFTQRNRYNSDGFYKMGAVLGSLPDLDPHEEKALLAGLKGVYRRDEYTQALAESGNSAGPEEFKALTTLIHGTKFTDPNLERLRKLAAPKLREHTEQLDRAVARLSE